MAKKILAESKKVFIGTHIPKTAGSSLIKIFEQRLGFHKFYQATSLKKNAEFGIPMLEEISNTNTFEVIFGHHVDEQTLILFPERSIYLFTFIREPIQRIVSHYYYRNRHMVKQNLGSVDFSTYYSQNPKNYVCNWLIRNFSSFLDETDYDEPLHKKALVILKNFQFVCSTEEFDLKVKDFLEDVGIVIEENTSPPRANTTKYEGLKEDLDLEKIKLDNQEDIKLYNHFIEARTHNVNAKNPLGFSGDSLEKNLSKLFKSKSYNRQNRLKFLFTKASDEYQRFGYLDKELMKSKQKILDETLKYQILLSKKNNTNISNTDLFVGIKEILG